MLKYRNHLRKKAIFAPAKVSKMGLSFRKRAKNDEIMAHLRKCFGGIYV